MKGYLGAKNGSGVYQTIINLLPPHDTYIELFLGTGAVMKRKAPASRQIGIDLNRECIDGFESEHDVELLNVCAFDFMRSFDFSSSGRTVIYADPTYVRETRTSNARYKFELTDQQHVELLDILESVDAFVLLSGYRNRIYERLTWWSVDFQAMTRGGVRTETVWCNFEPKDIHYHTYAGKNFTDRQRIQRKSARWASSYAKLPAGERSAILSALMQVESDLQQRNS